MANPHVCFISDGFTAVLCRDPNWGNGANPATGIGSDYTQFAGMSNKNDDDIDPGMDPWNWGGGNSGGPQKNDLTNTYLATVIDDCDNLWLFFGAETRSISGDSHVDFEFNQAGVTVTGAQAGGIFGNGSLGGRTVGDFIVSIDFEQGGGQPVLSFRTWDGAMYNMVSPPTYVSCGIDQSTTGAANVFVRTVTEAEEEADGGLGGGVWGHFNKNGSDNPDPHPLQMVEGAVNLTALELPIDLCSANATIMFKTRSSQSFTAELKDFSLIRFPLLPSPECEITGDEEELVCPGATGVRYSVAELTGLDVTYEWTIMGDASFSEGTDTTSSTVNVDVDTVCDSSFELWATVTTDFGCSSECHLQVAIDDDIDPMITCPDDVDVEGCDADDLPDPFLTLEDFLAAMGASASDNCDNDLDFFYDGQTSDGQTCPATFTRTYRVRDDCGNEATCMQTLTVDDNTDPMITCPPTENVEGCDLSDLPPAYTTLAAFIAAGGSASDNCDDLTLSHSDSAPSGTCPITVMRTYRVTDDCENYKECTQTITIDDTEDPMISCPPGQDLEGCDLSSLPAPFTTVAAFVAAGGSASDNCDDDLVLTSSDSAPSGMCPITIVRTYRVTDDCDNYKECTQTFRIDDTEDPMISCPPTQNVEGCDLSDLPAAFTTLAAFEAAGGSASDNCDNDLTLTSSDSAPSGMCPITVVRTYRVTDDCDNYEECTQTITIDDTISPTITCPAGGELSCGVPETFTVTGFDACDDDLTFNCQITGGVNLENVTLTPLGGGDFQIVFSGSGSATVTCTATDDCDNTSTSCSFTVSAECGSACSPGYWKNHFDSWCFAGYQPLDNYCPSGGDATLFLDAFEITDMSAAPPEFDPNMRLIQAVRMNGGPYKQTLFHGTAALLNAAHPAVGFGHSVSAVQAVMQDAFSGAISFSEAHGIFAGWNSVEQQGGCPLN